MNTEQHSNDILPSNIDKPPPTLHDDAEEAEGHWLRYWIGVLVPLLFLLVIAAAFWNDNTRQGTVVTTVIVCLAVGYLAYANKKWSDARFARLRKAIMRDTGRKGAAARRGGGSGGTDECHTACWPGDGSPHSATAGRLQRVAQPPERWRSVGETLVPPVLSSHWRRISFNNSPMFMPRISAAARMRRHSSGSTSRTVVCVALVLMAMHAL
jgi:hypothetical protein